VGKKGRMSRGAPSHCGINQFQHSKIDGYDDKEYEVFTIDSVGDDFVLLQGEPNDLYCCPLNSFYFSIIE
jgi:hypothetical protein